MGPFHPAGLPGAACGDLLRAAVALLLAVGLYPLLADSGEPPRRLSPRRFLYCALAALTLFGLLLPQRTAPRGEQGRAFRSYVDGVLAARRSFASSSLLRGEPHYSGELSQPLLRQAIREYEAAVRANPDAVTYHRELAVLYAVAARWDAARNSASAAVRLLEERRSPEAARLRALWEIAAATSPAKRDESLQVETALGGTSLGWYGPVLLYAVNQRGGRRDAAEDRLTVIARRANDYLLILSLLALTQVGMMLVGLILVIVGAVLLVCRVLRPVPAELRPVSALLWEGFILFMALGLLPLLPRLFGPAMQRAAVPRAPGTVVAMALLTDGLGLIALAYVAWRLRRRGLDLGEIGLRAGRPAVNLLYGAAAYVAIAPFVTLATLLFQALGERFFPNVPPPYHPVSSLLIASHDAWIRAGLFALLVLGAPFFEELFFRGLLYGALRRRFGVAAGALASSAIFAILHPQLPLGFIPIFLLGVGLALIYEWRGSLLPGMALHAANNGVLFVAMTALFPLRG